MSVSLLTGKPRAVPRGNAAGDDPAFQTDLREAMRAAARGLVREMRHALGEQEQQLPLELPEAPPVDLEALREQVKDALRADLDQRDDSLREAIKDVAVAVASIPTPEPVSLDRPRTVYRLDVKRNFKSLVTEIAAAPADRNAPAYTFIVHRDYNDLVSWLEVKASLPRKAEG